MSFGKNYRFIRRLLGVSRSISNKNLYKRFFAKVEARMRETIGQIKLSKPKLGSKLYLQAKTNL